MAEAATLLGMTDVTVRFGGLAALDGVSFGVTAGQVHGIVGPNGAGKTTLFNVISGLTPVTAGHILLDGVPVQRAPSHQRAKLGMARTFQNIRLFREMTVLENVMTGMHTTLRHPAAGVLLRLPGFRREERRAHERASAMLEIVGLADQAERIAGSLPYGDQRRLEIGRALASSPKLLLLDEPAAGMNPAETEALSMLIRRIAADGITLLLIEHDMGFVMRLCEIVTVLNFGRRIAEGSPREIRENPAVIEAYLGAKLAARLTAQSQSGSLRMGARS